MSEFVGENGGEPVHLAGFQEESPPACPLHVAPGQHHSPGAGPLLLGTAGSRESY